MQRLLKACAILMIGYLIGCSPVKFTEDTSCGSFGNQECEVGPLGIQRYDNTFVVGPLEADILFIDDNSGSMSVEQSKMAEKFPNFISSLGTVDYRIAVTTTDVATSSNPPDSVNDNGALQDGRFIEFSSGVSVLTPSTANAEQLFLDTVKRPETLSCEANNFDADFCPSPDERAIVAANLAVDRGHDEFFRPGAHLAIVILSDEDERSKSGEIPGYELATYDKPQVLIDNVKAKFGADKSFAVHAIMIKPGDTSCLQQQNAQHGVSGFEGKVYQELVDLTNGHAGSVCASDYGVEMGQIGAAVLSDVNSLELACAPLNDEFTALVEPVPAGLEVSLDKDAKKIRFNQSLPPNTSVRLIYDCES